MRRMDVTIGMALLVSAGSARAQSAEPPKAPAFGGWCGGFDASVGPFPGVSEDVVGGAVDGRFGYRLDDGRLFLTPEAILGLVLIGRQIAGQTQLSTESAWIGAGLRAGGRLWRIEPSLYSHGFIWFGGKTTAPAVEVGAALDFRIFRSVSVGAHAAYVLAHEGRSIDFGILGLHVDVVR